MGKALVIEHDETGPVGGVGERLVEHGFELHPFRVLDDPSDPVCTKEFPDPTNYDVVVVLGSPWSVCEKGPIESWIDREIDLVRNAHRSGTPVLNTQIPDRPRGVLRSSSISTVLGAIP